MKEYNVYNNKMATDARHFTHCKSSNQPTEESYFSEEDYSTTRGSINMLVQSNGVTHNRHKDGVCLTQRRAGKETLVQWSNGDQRWCHTSDLVGNIVLLQGNGTHYEED